MKKIHRRKYSESSRRYTKRYVAVYSFKNVVYRDQQYNFEWAEHLWNLLQVHLRC